MVLLPMGSVVGWVAEGQSMKTIGKRIGSLIAIVLALPALSMRLEASQCFDISKGQPEHLSGQLLYKIFPYRSILGRLLCRSEYGWEIAGVVAVEGGDNDELGCFLLTQQMRV
ncbi:hypothetical protein NKH95_10905 [Mesorhizobium sp. M0848]|uniref:hypothetical protein n=1 Tax=Mesorhizobium sp. M0848 TaxID=2957012 RepID=UPI00333A03AA